ncbi:MAG TPA: PIG-L deacetylase family protein [Chloroflexota bacterium]|nr:PIG-L deacetylase family protein [Chloroflexota bacterium]
MANTFQQQTAQISVPRSILVFYAHPDDESFGPSAVLAKYARLGSSVYGWVATRGEAGQSNHHPPPAPDELMRWRVEDLEAATQAIGFAGLEVLDYEDGKLDQVPVPKLADQVMAELRRRRPQVVLTFGPAGITRHSDHLIVHRVVSAAFYQALAEGLAVRELYYDAVGPEAARALGLVGTPDGEPNTWIDVTGTWPVKLEALRLHGRHILDAQEMATRLENAPPIKLSPLYRAYPPVPADTEVTEFLGANLSGGA